MKRSYRQNCALALSSDLLGERWTLLIIRELLIQPCRFKDLNSVLIGMGTNLLTNRLKELEAAGLIERQSANDKRSPYQLSPRGVEAEPILLAMIRWGNGSLVGEEDYSHQDHWDLLAMKALFNPLLFSPTQALQCITVVFTSGNFTGWASAGTEGLSFGLGVYKTERCDESIIELPMTIAQLNNILISDHHEKKILLKDNQHLAKFIACFS